MTKYQELKDKFEYIRDTKTSQLSTISLATYEYPRLIEEILEQFKLLEDNLEWRKKVEATEWGDVDTDYFESDEERQEWNDFWKKKIEEVREK